MKMNKKQRFFLAIMMFLTLCGVCSAGDFDFDRDKGFSDSTVILSKDSNGERVDFMKVHLFIVSTLRENGIEIPDIPDHSLGFMIFEVLDETTLQEINKGKFVYDYYYTPFWGHLKDEDKYVETYLHYEENDEDFGGRSYCPDCGEPMACGTRYISISGKRPIWLKNIWIDFEKSYKFDLQWTVDGVDLSLIYQKK